MLYTIICATVVAASTLSRGSIGISRGATISLHGAPRQSTKVRAMGEGHSPTAGYSTLLQAAGSSSIHRSHPILPSVSTFSAANMAAAPSSPLYSSSLVSSPGNSAKGWRLEKRSRRRSSSPWLGQARSKSNEEEIHDNGETSSNPVGFAVATTKKPRSPTTTTTTLKLNKAADVAGAAMALVGSSMLYPSLANAEAITATTTAFSGGFLQALSLVFASEIGDKTFFIAALLSMRSSRLLAFGGSMLALITMTIISVLIGQIFHNVPASLTGGLPLDDYAAIAFLGYFGVKSLIDAYNLPDDSAGVDDELEEAEKDVAGTKGDTQIQLLLEAFTLVFTAELGDRSFLATIALSAAQNPVMVASGAILAHSLATGIAVASGALLAKYISEKVVGYVGGSLFLAFAVTTALGLF